MIETSVKIFISNINSYVDEALSIHSPLRVKRRVGNDFMVISAEDWERDQETLYILQNTSLSKQIIESLKTHYNNSGEAKR
jgi:antitoxin YefM